MSAPGSRTVRVRRGPRVWTFVAAGGALGVVAAVVLTFAFPRGGQYDTGQVLAFLALIGLAVGVLAGGLVALVLDAVSRRRARVVTAEQDRIRVAPDDEASTGG